MLLLASSLDALNVITSTTGNIEVHASYVDNNSGVVNAGRTNTIITTATTTTIVTGPADGIQRNVRTFYLKNDVPAGSNTVTIEHTDGTKITTLWKGNLQLNPAMLFSIGLVSTFITGGLTGIILGDSTLDINVHDTYFVVAHFHLVMGISALYGMFAGIYHWFPKMFGRMLNKNLGYVHFWVTAVCAYGVFFPMHFIGLAGLPRRYYSNTNFPLFDDLQNVNVLITTFALIGGVFQLVFLYNFFSSIFYGKKAVQNPWRSNTLEWTTPVEHMHGNWPGEIPEVHRWPYDYSNPGHDEDFVPQNVPMKEGEVVLHH
jgi:cytochrome c oxidase subunit 1